MRFKTIAFALIVSSAVFILGCSETDRINEDMELSFEVTFDPPLDSAYARIYGADAFASVGSLIPPVDFVTVTGLTTNETTVSRTQSLTVVIEVTSTHSTNYCSDVQVQAFLNGLSFDVRTFNMGGLSALTTCPDGEQQVYNLIIP